MARKRLNIGLVTSGFHDDYSNSVCRGITAAAEEHGCNLFVFPCRFIDYKSEPYSSQNICRQYNTTSAYASDKNLDFIIVSTGAIFRSPNQDDVRAFFESFGNIPVISLSVNVEGYPYVRHDCTDGLTSVINHLITAHDCRKLAFIAGPENHPDSTSRLNVFRQVLASHGLSCSDDYVFHSDFSEFHYQDIADFLRSHNFDVDAICCANDASASAVYKALEENGLRPGIDILVTGYDNLSFAASCLPALTTVCADAADCAYRAAIIGIEALNSGKKLTSVDLSTYPVFRESCCGLASLSSFHDDAASDAMKEMDLYISKWISQYASHDDPSTPRFINSYSRRFLGLLFSELDNPEVTDLSREQLLQSFNEFAINCSTDNMAANTLCDFLRMVHHVAIQKTRSPHIETQVHSLFVSFYRILNGTMNTINYALTTETRHCMSFANFLSQTSVNFEDGINSTLIAIMGQIHNLGIPRSYLYLNKQPRQVSTPEEIVPFDQLHLVAYHHGNSCFSLFDKPLKVERHQLIANKYVSTNARTTMFITPLFSAHEQYGILVSEVAYHHLSLFQALIRQISTEIETAYLFARLNRQLNETTNENLILSKMATRDALTSCYNRHGFFERAGSAIISPLNTGRHGLLVFADLNCLKLINDSFGHDEGDFALCQTSDALRDCFGRSGIVGRIGGDEFVALMITDDQNYTCDALYQKLRKQISLCSENSGKPYHITISIGITDFTCCESLSLQKLIDTADHLQYLDKRNKPDNINKQ